MREGPPKKGPRPMGIKGRGEVLELSRKTRGTMGAVLLAAYPNVAAKETAPFDSLR